jgi:hypothetical protein
MNYARGMKRTKSCTVHTGRGKKLYAFVERWNDKQEPCTVHRWWRETRFIRPVGSTDTLSGTQPFILLSLGTNGALSDGV